MIHQILYTVGVVLHNVLIVRRGLIAKNVDNYFVTNAHQHVAIAKRVTAKLVIVVRTVKDQDVWHRRIHKRYHVVIVI